MVYNPQHKQICVSIIIMLQHEYSDIYPIPFPTLSFTISIKLYNNKTQRGGQELNLCLSISISIVYQNNKTLKHGFKVRLFVTTVNST